MQQQQQHANFDLLAVFSEESRADAAEARLHKEGFGDDEVFRLPPGAVGRSEFREHGPDRERSAVFLQTTRSGPGPLVVMLFILVFALIAGALTFGVADIGFHSIPLLPATLLGALVGVIVGAALGLTRKGRVRGAIGQQHAAPAPAPAPQPSGEPRTVIAVRLPDPENISRKSKARAILLNNGGKIDRSVGSS